jgi:hypothetical protein
MSNAHEIAQNVQAEQGWTDATLLDVLLDYIANQESDDALADYLAERGDPVIPFIVVPGGGPRDSDPAWEWPPEGKD